jgi:hypothetical protein
MLTTDITCEVYVLRGAFTCKCYQDILLEMRVAAYNQLLESYSSVTLKSMASSFGVSEDFIDKYSSLLRL